MPAPDSDDYITLTSEEEPAGRNVRHAPPGRKGGPLAAVPPRGLLTRSQTAAQTTATHPREGGVKLSTRARAAGRNAGRPRAAALSELQQARAGRVAAAAASARPVRQTRARAVVQDSGSDGDGSGSGGDDVAQPRPRRRATRTAAAARSRTRFLRGGRDYVESSSDTDMAGFIAEGSEDEPSASSSEDGPSASDDAEQHPSASDGEAREASGSDSEEEHPSGSDSDFQPEPEHNSSSSASPTPPPASGRSRRGTAARMPHAARGRRLARAPVAAAAAAARDSDSSAEQGAAAVGNAAAGQAVAPPEEAAEEGEAVLPRPRKRRAAAVVLSSESEDEAAALGCGDGGHAAAAQAGAAGGRRRRLRRAHEDPDPDGREADGHPPPSPPQRQPATRGPGPGDSLAAGRRRRTPPPRPRLTAGDRIRQAQQAWQLDGTSGRDTLGGDGAEGNALAAAADEGEVSVLTDEGDPGDSPDEDEGGDEGAQRRPDGDHGWQRAADVLGLGTYSARQLFDIYVEFALMCYIDPGYAESVRDSPAHEQYYRRAVNHVESEMTRLRASVASDAWKSSARGLLQAVESLPGIEPGWADEDTAQELAGAPCDACNRRRSHATRELILKGVPSAAPAWGDATLISNRRLSDQFAATSRVFQQQHDLLVDAGSNRWQAVQGGSEEEEEAQEEEAGEGHGKQAAPPARYTLRRFHVGRFCCGRLTLYHALFHWRRRLLARLKRELKAELRRRKRGGFPCDRSVVAEAVLRKDSLMHDLHSNYCRLLKLAERYQLFGGEESRGGWRKEFEGVHAEAEAAVRELHSGSEAEEASVAWPDEAISSGSDDDGNSRAEQDDGIRGGGGEAAQQEGQPEGGALRLRQARIRFGVPLRPTAPAAQQRAAAAGSSGAEPGQRGDLPAGGVQAEPPAAQAEAPAPPPPSSTAGRSRQADIRSFFSPRQQ